MCYIDIEQNKEPVKEHYWKVVYVYKGNYYGANTYEPIKKDQWNISKNVSNSHNPVDSNLNQKFRGHSYQSGFEGFGVFETRKIARLYKYDYHRTSLWGFRKVVKVIARDNARTGKISDSNNLPCYIFNQIKIID